MKKQFITTIILIIFILITNVSEVRAKEIDLTLKNLDLSGFLRIRSWYTASKIKVPGKFASTDNYKRVFYQDLFLRNRLTLKVIPTLELRTTFDVFAALGKPGDGFAMGSGNTNIITRNIYGVYKFSSNSEISIGLMPFSLPGGYILARDASGFQFKHNILNNKIQAYMSFIKAFDDANDVYGENSNPPDYADDNIYILGSNMNLISSFSTEVYYAFEMDKYTSDSDERKSDLNWIGIHTKSGTSDLLFRLGGIYNWGTLSIFDDTTAKFVDHDIFASLFEFELGYRLPVLQCSLVAEGATGDPNDPNSENSFQDIKSSHGFSFFVVDNSGGLALRGSGESSWYGMWGSGIKLNTTKGNFILETKLLHFETMKRLTLENTKSRYLGDEWDIKADYVYKEILTLSFSSALFKPNDAYKALDIVQDNQDGYVIEAMFSAKVTY